MPPDLTSDKLLNRLGLYNQEPVRVRHELDNGYIVSVLVDGPCTYSDPSKNLVEVAVMHPEGGFVQPSLYTDNPDHDGNQVVGYYPNDKIEAIVDRVAQWDSDTVKPNYWPTVWDW